MNKNRKLRFNAIDVLILLLIAAVIYVVLNVFVLNSDGSQNSSVNYKTIQYVVEVGNLDERFAQSVKAGQSVQDAIEKKSNRNSSRRSVRALQKEQFQL